MVHGARGQEILLKNSEGWQSKRQALALASAETAREGAVLRALPPADSRVWGILRANPNRLPYAGGGGILAECHESQKARLQVQPASFPANFLGKVPPTPSKGTP